MPIPEDDVFDDQAPPTSDWERAVSSADYLRSTSPLGDDNVPAVPNSPSRPDQPEVPFLTQPFQAYDGLEWKATLAFGENYPGRPDGHPSTDYTLQRDGVPVAGLNRAGYGQDDYVQGAVVFSPVSGTIISAQIDANAGGVVIVRSDPFPYDVLDADGNVLVAAGQ